jgi:hypothetical protein
MKPFFRRARLLPFLPVLLFFCAQPILAQYGSVSSGRERLSLDRGWLFHEGDIPFPVVIGHQASYDNAKARAATQKTVGQLLLRDVVGKAQVFIDGKLDAEKTEAAKGDITVTFPPGNGERTVGVVIEASSPDEPAGLGGLVTVE